MAAKKTIKKESWKPGNVLAPLPVVMVTCGGTEEFKANIITIAWAGTVCSEPPMLSISVRPNRHSYDIIKTTGEFAVNVPSRKLARVTDWCGVYSGRKVDKFAETGLTPIPAQELDCPVIAECPINIECKVRNSLELGAHTMFVAEVVAVQVSAELIDKKGAFHPEQASMIVFGVGQYFALGPVIDKFGFSARKEKKKPTRKKTVRKPASRSSKKAKPKRGRK